MPYLTDVKITKDGRCALFLDGTFAFSVSQQLFADAGIHTGCEIDADRLEQLRGQSDATRALEKALALLRYRDHTAAELTQKLCRTFDEETAAGAVQKLTEMGYLDDERFAQSRAEALYRKHKSRREILCDLRAKGVDPACAGRAVESLGDAGADKQGDFDPELSSAVALLQGRYADKLAQGRRDLVAAALQRRGFGRAVIRAALRMIEEESGSV